MSLSLYRKYRSQTFDELVGQEPVVKTLKNAISTGRIGHAYLFTGPRGVGKTSAARLLARAANCLSDGPDKPCNECANCLAASRDIATDLIEIDAASNTGVDNIRELIDKANFTPSIWNTKFYVVDECFRYEDLVTLANGSKMPIGKLVESQWQGEILSYNETTQQVEPKPILRHMKKVPSLPMLRITFDNRRAIECTFNHKFYTPHGKKHASDLEVGQFVYANYERITRHQLDVVAGAAIGDGHLSMTGNGMRSRLSISQGVAQKDFLDYKARLLGDLVATQPQYQRSEKSFSKTGIYRLATLSKPQIAELHRELYDPAGRKRINAAYLNRIGTLGLALWYMDDGSLVTQHFRYERKKDGTIADHPITRSTFSTYGFRKDEVEIARQWLRDKWSIEGGISSTAKGPVLWLTVEGTRRLHELIASHVPPCMQYKLYPEYRGTFAQPVSDDRMAGLAVSTVKKIEWVPSTDYVYNIEVADNHNYFVRDILVANCHMLTVSAFNALLKTLEEPPPHVAFILATTEVHKVPATVASRCQRFDFRRVPLKAMVDRLRWVCDREDIEVEDAALELVARQSTGSLRDALSLLDQLRVFSEGGIRLSEVQDMLGASGSERVADFVDCLVSSDLSGGLRLINAILDEGLDIRQFNRQTVEHLRQLMLIKSGAAQSSEDSLLDVTEEMKRRMEGQSSRVALPDLLRWTKVFAAADSELRSTAYRQLPLEMALVEAILPPAATQIGGQSAEILSGSQSSGLAPAEHARSPQPTTSQPNTNGQHPPQPARQAPPATQSTAPPPPINVDLGQYKTQHAPNEVPAPEKTVPAEIEPVAPVDGHTSALPLELAPAEAASEDDGELGTLKRLWPNLIDQINARSKQMAAVFRDPAQVRPHSVSGKMVTISFRDQFYAQRAKGDAQRKLLEGALSITLGRPCTVEAITFAEEAQGRSSTDDAGPGGTTASRTPKDKPPAPHETPRGRAAMNTFGIDKFDTSDE